MLGNMAIVSVSDRILLITDTDGDLVADEYLCVSNGWGVTGNYHEYAFGPKLDGQGNLWMTLNIGMGFQGKQSSLMVRNKTLGVAQARWRGWGVKVTPQGKLVPVCAGMRSPSGLGANRAGDMFYTDNQGPWNGTSKLQHLEPGTFVGHPGGNRWYDITNALGKRPADPKSGSRMMVEAKRIPAN